MHLQQPICFDRKRPMTKRIGLVLSVVAGFLVIALSAEGAGETKPQIDDAYGKLPLGFEANHGQAAEEIDFIARGPGYSLALSPIEAVFALRKSQRDSGSKNSGQRTAGPVPQSEVLRMIVVGANRDAAEEGEDESEGRVNYFIGNDPERWRRNVPTFGRVRYTDVYSGIDLIYYGNQRRLEYDFVVKPGADPCLIVLEFAGASSVELEEATGDLLVQVGEETIRQHAPVTYQEIDGRRQEVESRYTLNKEGQVSFEIGAYDSSAPLIIDPVLVYSTFLGGSGEDDGQAIAVDGAGNAYVTGRATSTDFPRAAAARGTHAGGTFDVFVTKFNPTGSAIVYSTYLGGDDDEISRDIAVDAAGNAYICGTTSSQNFPTTQGFRTAYAGGVSDGFVTKLDSTGAALVYSTYLGGSTGGDNNGADGANGIAVDSAGHAYVVGDTDSIDFPVVNGFQSSRSGDPNILNDAFVTKFDAAGSGLIYSTYLGGAGGDTAIDIAVDSDGNAYVTGDTSSENFPTANAFQNTIVVGDGPPLDVFVTKLNAAGSALVYSTFLGGNQVDFAAGIAIDADGSAHVAGLTESTNFPIANAIQNANAGEFDVFVTKLHPNGSSLIYSTYLGGSGGAHTEERASGIALDSAGNAYVAGGTESRDFPVFNAIQSTYGGGFQDAFVFKLTPVGSLVYSTYLGGGEAPDNNGFDSAFAIAVDAAGNAYMTGGTRSPAFPTAHPVQLQKCFGNFSAFVTKIGELGNSPPHQGNGVAQNTLANISTRLPVLRGENVLIGGFIIVGDVPKRVVIRALGPSLAKVGVPGALDDPRLELYQGQTVLAANDNWREEQEAEIIATGVAPGDNRESAIVRTLSPGSYTAIVRGAGDTTGVGLVEVYDLEQGPASKLANISTRGFVNTGDNVLIGGFIVGEYTTVAVRAIGPSLGAVGVGDALQNPMLELVDAYGSVCCRNDDWKSDQQALIEAIGLPPSDERESTLITTVAAGSYTGVVRGVGGTTGVGLVEVYNVGPTPPPSTPSPTPTPTATPLPTATPTPTPTPAATRTVTNTSDSGPGSLRQAILDANASSGPDVITFDSTLFATPRTIVLAGTVLTIDDASNGPLTILGPGADRLTISGNQLSRVFAVASGDVASISGLTVTQGNSLTGAFPGYGGGIYNSGTLTVTKLIVTGNKATIDGGGIYNSASDTLKVENSIISNNVADSDNGGSGNGGGGLYNDTFGKMTLIYSTVSGNSVGSLADGGGIYTAGSTTMITNSTISGNSSGNDGGGIYVRGTFDVTVINCTIAKNTAARDGGGVWTDDSIFNLRNTIVGDNIDDGTAPDFLGTVDSACYNLIEQTSGTTITGDVTGNITGADPKLETLLGNGGFTPNHALLEGSPAIDKGESSGSGSDQRGAQRPVDDPLIGNAPGGDGADIGAFEVQNED